MSNAGLRNAPEISEAEAVKLNAIAAASELCIIALVALERAVNIVEPFTSKLAVPGGPMNRCDALFAVAASAYNSVARPLEEMGVIQRTKAESPAVEKKIVA